MSQGTELGTGRKAQYKQKPRELLRRAQPRQRPWGSSCRAQHIQRFLPREGYVRTSSGRHPGPCASAPLTTLSRRQECRQQISFNYKWQRLGSQPGDMRRDFKASVSSPALGRNTRMAGLMSSGIHPETALASSRSLPGLETMFTAYRQKWVGARASLGLSTQSWSHADAVGSQKSQGPQARPAHVDGWPLMKTCEAIWPLSLWCR